MPVMPRVSDPAAPRVHGVALCVVDILHTITVALQAVLTILPTVPLTN